MRAFVSVVHLFRAVPVETHARGHFARSGICDACSNILHEVARVLVNRIGAQIAETLVVAILVLTYTDGDTVLQVLHIFGK